MRLVPGAEDPCWATPTAHFHVLGKGDEPIGMIDSLNEEASGTALEKKIAIRIRKN